MRHHNKNRKFGRTQGVRRALLKSLLLSLIKHGRIKTTEAKAKEIRPLMEKLITKALLNTLASRRMIMSRLINQDKEVKKLIDVIAPKYKGQKGGYTRILKLPQRLSDGANLAIIELV